MNFYNEFDPNAAAWLRELIAQGLIPDGVVDERSITEITPHDLSGYTQCHWFSGVGGWPLALRLAGFPDDRPVWTASLPCQPFSTAGKQNGTGDDRHLWPVFERLVRACNPPVVIGEQVASKLARDDWFPGVRMDLEALGYEVGAADFCAPCAGEIGEGRIVRGDQETWERIVIGAPHIRQRLYWVADANSQRRAGIYALLRAEETGTDGAGHFPEAAGRCENGGLADAPSGGLGVNGSASRGAGHADECGEADSDRGLYDDAKGWVDDSGSGGRKVAVQQSGDGGKESGLRETSLAGGPGAHRWLGDAGGEGPQGHAGDGGDGDQSGRQHPQPLGPVGSASWSDFDIIPCRDGKARRIESGSFPLVAGLPRGMVSSGDPGLPSYANQTAEARAMRLKGYGNAICAPLAAAFIRAYLDARS